MNTFRLPPAGFYAQQLGIGISLVALAGVATLQAADPFAEGVRTTDPKTPEQQRAMFRLPPGFEIQLVASEPDIRKPMNMAFDTRGRLWVTESREYPFPAPLDKPARDSVRIFSDFGTNGRPAKMTIFADGLNIPIGVYPYRDGAVVWSIPNIWFLRDTNGDGTADTREVLFGPLGWERDTHGNIASFKRGFDGWLYGTHGFNNNTTFKAKDGSTLVLNSGNTYRIRLDGSRVEPHTWGQVNPFGTAWDAAGNLYTSDCHSAPIYQLLAGGVYPSFGKPHDGLGFAPSMMEHAHGSTAIDGMFYYADNLWPAEYIDNTFVGNVMTSRLNRDRIEFTGSSPKAVEQPDFLLTEDPWFRPVDNQLGPDGALYIADFYNRIIGHYEVPLQHPGRDRERGRIWRVVYRGADGKIRLHNRKIQIATAGSKELIKELADPNLTWRMMAMNEICDRIGPAAIEPVRKAWDARNASPLLKAHGLWILQRMGAMDAGRLTKAAAHPDRIVRIHAMRVLGEMKEWPKGAEKLALAGLTDSDALVQRCAVEALGRHPALENVEPILKLAERVPSGDTHLTYVVRKGLRDHLLVDDIISGVTAKTWSDAQAVRLVDAAMGAKTGRAGSLLLKYAHLVPAENKGRLAELLQHAARHAPTTELGRLAEFARKHFATDLETQVTLYRAVDQGVKQRGGDRPTELGSWGDSLARQLAESIEGTAKEWWNVAVEAGNSAANPWNWETRPCTDGKRERLLSSLPGGEALTGAIRSRVFKAPASLSFFLAGHDGAPERPAQGRNAARLRDAATGDVIAQAAAPRSDMAQQIRWDLSRVQGQDVYFEVTDADTGGAFAWIAFGRMEPAVASWPTVAPSIISSRQEAVAEIALASNSNVMNETMTGWLKASSTELSARVTLARVLANQSNRPTLRLAADLAGDNALPPVWRRKIAEEVLAVEASNWDSWLPQFWKNAPHRAQVRAAAILAGQSSAEKFLEWTTAGTLPPVVLREQSVRERLEAKATPGEKQQIARIVSNLPAADSTRQKLIDQLRAGYTPSSASASRGTAIFNQNCRVCHRIGADGGLVGPQLDGIGNRGLERLLEDVIDSNRNVDKAFRTRLIRLKDDEVVSGLFRREDGVLIVLADATGKEITVAKNQVVAMTESESSLMPDNFGEALPAEAMADLMAFLLDQRKKAEH